MDTQLLVFSGVVSASVLLALLGIALLVADRRKRDIRRRLEEIHFEESDEFDGVSVTRDMKLSSIPLLDAVLKRIRFMVQLESLLTRADIGMRVGPFFFLMLLLGMLGGMIGYRAYPHFLAWIGGALVLGSTPLLYARYRKSKRVWAFERQFPDALDLLTGALRSGMAFTGALQVVAEESPDPVGKEFTIVFEEHRLGLALRESLNELAFRVESREVRLFVTAVLLQRDMGGNLAEILEGTAAIIRDRFRILGDVRTITAQARLSGAILTILPLFMVGFLVVVAPEYLQALLDDPIGPYMIGTAVTLQLVGFIWIRKIIKIKV